MLQKGEEKAISHLQAIKLDTRNEIKDRIKQRDQYSIQLTISLGLIIAVSFPPNGFTRALMAAPLVSIYFTVLILYSYRVHKLLAQYLRDEIEPELSRLCGTLPVKEWETYYSAHTVPGIRRNFFILALWVTSAISLLYLWLTQNADTSFKIVLLVATIVYIAAILAITIAFWKR